MTATFYPHCPLCEAVCGLEVKTDAGRITSIRGDRADPLSRGHICPKAVALPDVQDDPDRVRVPLRRQGEQWVEVSWDDALTEAVGHLLAIRKSHGKDAVAFYYGNPTSHDYGATLYRMLLQTALGTRNVYSNVSVDGLPRMLTSLQMYGSQAVIPVPDIDRTDFLLILGANPAVSNGSFMTAPGYRARLRALRERGGRLVVVDPRRTRTAEMADTHLFIRPATDAFLLLGMLHALNVEHAVIRDACAPFPPSLAAVRTGIPEEQIVQLARDFSSARTAVCYGRMGTCVQEFGTLTTWLIDVLNIVTGNFDRPGGAMFPSPAFDLAAMAALAGQNGSFGKFRSRVSGYPEFSGELPVAALAEEIETAGAGQIRGLITYAGNPALSAPGSGRIDDALAKLDYMVAIDIYLNETTRHANLVLPPTFGLEHDNYPLLFHALAVRNTARWSPAAVEPPTGCRPAWQILLDLSAGLMGWKGRPLRWLAAGGPQGLLRMALRFGPKKLRFADLLSNPHGVDFGPLVPRLPGVLRTPDRKIRLAPPDMLADLRRLTASPRETGLLLIGGRDIRSNNSWMHNSQRLMRGPLRSTLKVHPQDAEARGLVNGDTVYVSSSGGAIEAVVEQTEEMMPGVVSLPHGWGHTPRPGMRLSVAVQQPGANVNELTVESRVDVLSGCSALNGTPVQVRARVSTATIPQGGSGVRCVGTTPGSPASDGV